MVPTSWGPRPMSDAQRAKPVKWLTSWNTSLDLLWWLPLRWCTVRQWNALSKHMPFINSDASAVVISRTTLSLIICTTGRYSLESEICETRDLRDWGQLTPLPLCPVSTRGPSRAVECWPGLAVLYSCFVYHNELVNKHHKLFISINLDRLLFMKSI